MARSRMKILHYTVGLGENRGGGLTKYVDDLVAFQSKDNSVIILYPGEYNLINRNVYIKKEKSKNGVPVYSIINPLSLPMLFGLKDADYLTKKTPISLWKQFIEDNKFDLIHIHTMIGLYEEFIDAANELNVPIIYTTHDYFGLCTKQVYVYNNKICENWNTCVDCPECNKYAFSKEKTFIIHSKLFCKLRKNKLFLKIKGKAKNRIEQVDSETDNLPMNGQIFYKNLKVKYAKLFKQIDWFHFNSSVSEWVFRRELPFIKGEIINLSHSDIKDHRKEKKFNTEKLQITYLGPATAVKGFDLLIETLDRTYSQNEKFKLNIYTYTTTEKEYLVKHGSRYDYSQLEKIMDETDILVAPSICLETFGFTVLEAMSYGVPVIVSDCLGARDLVKEGKNGFIINEKNLETTLLNIISNKDDLKTMNHNILIDNFESFDEHCHKIYSMYEEVCKRKKEIVS